MKKHLLDSCADAVARIAPTTAGAAEALGVAEAATRAGVSRTFLYERISSGELPTIKLGKRRLVRVEALRLWLKSLESPAA